MRWPIALLLVCGLCHAAPLVPPHGFSKSLRHTAAGGCVTLPAPYTGALVFRSKYEGSDHARATLNPEAERAYRSETARITDFERGISQMVWRYKRSGDAKTLACIQDGFARWADAGALTSTQTNHTGRAMRKWALATLATSWLELKSIPGQQPHHPATEQWLSRLAGAVINDWDDLPLSQTNNHSYWAAWAVMATAVALNRQDLFDWSLKQYRIAVSQITESGTLPNELKRRERAAAYHNYALQPLVMIASFAQANHIDLRQENNGALARLAAYVLQHDSAPLPWLEPWCTMAECDTVTALRREKQQPIKNRRLGGDLTQLYRDSEND